MNSTAKWLATLCAVAGIATGQAWASTITFDERPFDGWASLPSLTLGGLIFTPTTALTGQTYVYVNDGIKYRYGTNGDGGNSNSNGTNAILFEGGPNSHLMITRDGGGLFDLISIDLVVSLYDGNNVETIWVNGAPLQITKTLRTYTVDLRGVSEVAISGNSSYSGFWLADNVVYEAVSPVPLGTSLHFFLIGLLGFGGLLAWKRA